MSHYVTIILLLLPHLFLSGCGDPIEGHIAQLIEGGEAADEANIQLNLAKRSAIDPLSRAFQNQDLPSRTRVDLARALYRLYLREADERILPVLIGGLQDGDAAVRSGVARILGDMQRVEGVGPLINQLEREPSDSARREILVALEIIGLEGHEGTDLFWSSIKTDKMTAEEKERFIAIPGRITRL